MKQILVVGSSNIDLVASVDRMPLLGETVRGHCFARIPGGKGANQAYACGKLGAPTLFVSRVGDDGLGDLILANMAEVGVDCAYLCSTPGQPTGTATIWVDQSGNNSIVVVAGANAACDIRYLSGCADAFAQSDLLLVQLETPQEGIRYAIEQCAALGKIVILNPAPAPDKLPDDWYPLLDYITPNETELQKLTGVADTRDLDTVREGCRILLDKGVKNVLVTLGSKGAMLVNGRGDSLFVPPDIKVVDTTAAGDTFNAAFAVRLLEGASPEEAIVFANLASTIAVSHKGAQTSVPSREEVQRFAEKMQSVEEKVR